MDSGMDTGQFQMNTVEIPVAIDLLKVLDPFQKKSMSMSKLDSRNFLLVNDATARHYLTEMDPEYVREDKTKDGRTVASCCLSGWDAPVAVSWKLGSASKVHYQSTQAVVGREHYYLSIP